jgi:hypothetical protein
MIGNRVSAEPASTVDLPRTPARSQPRCRRVRELVCACRPLRDPEGRIISVPSVALSTPPVAAQIRPPRTWRKPSSASGSRKHQSRHHAVI